MLHHTSSIRTLAEQRGFVVYEPVRRSAARNRASGLRSPPAALHSAASPAPGPPPGSPAPALGCEPRPGPRGPVPRPPVPPRLPRTRMFHVKHLFVCHGRLRQLFHVKHCAGCRAAPASPRRPLPLLPRAFCERRARASRMRRQRGRIPDRIPTAKPPSGEL